MVAPLEPNKTLGEKDRWELHKDAASCSLKAASYKKAFEWPPTNDLIDEKVILANAGEARTNFKEIFSNGLLHMDSPVGQPATTYIHQLYGDTGYRLEKISRAMADRDGWRESEVRIG